MIVGKIDNGIVIDHIPAGKGMELFTDLKLDKLDCHVVLIKNADSKKHAKKDIIKVNETLDLNYDILGFIDPNITVNIIKNGEVIEKVCPTVPEVLVNLIFCKNPRCITTTEQELPHEFRLTDRENGIYRCIYCETKAESV